MFSSTGSGSSSLAEAAELFSAELLSPLLAVSVAAAGSHANAHNANQQHREDRFKVSFFHNKTS